MRFGALVADTEAAKTDPLALPLLFS